MKNNEYITLKEEQEISEAIKEERERIENALFELIMYDYDIDNLIHF